MWYSKCVFLKSVLQVILGQAVATNANARMEQSVKMWVELAPVCQAGLGHTVKNVREDRHRKYILNATAL